MTVVNMKHQIPDIGDKVVKITRNREKLDNIISIEFESGKHISAHIWAKDFEKILDLYEIHEHCL